MTHLTKMFVALIFTYIYNWIKNIQPKRKRIRVEFFSRI